MQADFGGAAQRRWLGLQQPIDSRFCAERPRTGRRSQSVPRVGTGATALAKKCYGCRRFEPAAFERVRAGLLRAPTWPECDRFAEWVDVGTVPSLPVFVPTLEGPGGSGLAL